MSSLGCVAVYSDEFGFSSLSFEFLGVPTTYIKRISLNLKLGFFIQIAKKNYNFLENTPSALCDQVSVLVWVQQLLGSH